MSDVVRSLPFSNEAINNAITRSLAEVPEGHTVAFVAAVDFANGDPALRMVVNVRLEKGWSFAGVLEGTAHGPITAAAELRFSL